MTREEAIEMIASMGKYMSSGNPIWKTEPVKEATDMAIEALNSVTDSENGAVESKNDVIKRQDAIKTVIRMCSPICDWELEKKGYTDCVIDEINSLPSAEAVHGEWIEVEVFPEVYDIEGVKTWGSEMQCDQCGFRHTAIEGHMAQYNFCPNCGSYNGGEQSD